MRTENMLVVWSAIQTGLSCKPFFLTERSQVIPLLQFFFLCASVVSYAALILVLFVPHFFLCMCLWKAVLRYCAIFGV